MKKYILVYPLAISALLSSCTGPRQASREKDTPKEGQVENRLSMYKKLEFDRAYFDGIKEKMAGNFGRAAQNFEEASRLDNRSSAAYYELGGCLLRMARFAEAETAMNRAIALDGDNPWYRLQMAEVYKGQKKVDQAAEVYNKLTEMQPGQSDNYFNLAEMFLYQKKYPEAVKVYDRIEKQFGHSNQITEQKLRIYFQMNKLDKAAEEARQLMEANPKDARFALLLVDVYRKDKKEDKANEILNSLDQKYPNNGDVQLALAEYYFNTNEPAKSKELLHKAFTNNQLDIDSKVAILYNNYLRPELTVKPDLSEAAELAAMLVAAHPTDAKSYAVQGDILYQQHKLPEALKSYRQSREIKNDVYAVWQQVFFINGEMHDAKALEAETEKALELFPNQPLVYLMNGRAKIDQKKYKEATAILESGLAQNIENHRLEAEFCSYLGEVYHREKKYEQSDRYYDKAVALYPTNATVLNNYAYYLSLRKDKMAQAAEMSERSLKIEPNNASFLDTYGWILYQQGKFQDAEKYIARSLEKEPGAAEVNEHYGDVLFRLGRTGEAVDHWKKAKQQGSESPELDKKISEKKIHE